MRNDLSFVMLAGLLVGLGCANGRTPEGVSGVGGGGSGAGGTAGTGGDGGSAGCGGSAGVSGSGGSAGVSGSGGSAGTGGTAGEGGEGGTAGSGGSGGISGSGGTGGGPSKPKCLAKDSQVVVIGDSYINWGTHTMPQDFKTVSNQSWRMYAVGGASMASGGISGFIPDQFEQAVFADPDITTVVMDGGGNDILIPNAFLGGGDCKNSTMAATMPACQNIVQMAIDRAITLMNRAADAGVKDVIYFFYPEVPEGTLIGGAHPRTILNYALPLVRETCEGAEARTSGKMKCHFIDTIPIFRGHDDWFAAADIHENAMGSMAIAQEVWQVMQDNCIAQKAGNSCCEP